ncbi:MAG: hypothetical protein V4466_10675 [Pseudomonadota bacterium]
MSHPIKPARPATGYLSDARSTGAGRTVRIADIAALRGTRASDPRK